MCKETTVPQGDVPDRLQSTGVLDNTVIRTTVRTESLTGYRYIKSDEIIVFKDLEASKITGEILRKAGGRNKGHQEREEIF